MLDTRYFLYNLIIETLGKDALSRGGDLHLFKSASLILPYANKIVISGEILKYKNEILLIHLLSVCLFAIATLKWSLENDFRDLKKKWKYIHS